MFKRFKIKTFSLFWVLGIWFLPQIELNGQCSGCKITIETNTTTIVTINAGEVVCVKPGVTYNGKIILNGGTLCNEGTVTNLSLNQGTFDNYGTYNNTANSLNISSVNALRINCYLNSSFLMANSINIATQNTTDSVVFNIYNGAKFSINGNLSINNGVLKIFNALLNPKSPSSIQSYFNIGGQLNVNNSQLKLVNYSFGIFNVNKSVNLTGNSNKRINNYGTFNVNNSLTVSGNGQNSGVVAINNYSNFNITKFLNLAYNNGTVNINNNQYKPAPVFQVGKSITISKDNNTFTNNSSLVANLDLIIDKGALINNSTVIARDVTINQATLTNNNTITANRDFIASSSQSNVNNNGYIQVARQFSNQGVFNLANGSAITTLDFDNQSQGNINGPNSINSTGTNYALILISGTSRNAGTIGGYLELVDLTLAPGATFVDTRTGGSSITSRVVSSINCAKISIGLTVFKSPPIQILPPPITLCKGDNIFVRAQSFLTVIIFGNPIPIPYLNPIGSGYSWTYTGITGPSTGNPTHLININNNITVNVKGVFNNSASSGTCLATSSININVSSLAANAGPDQLIMAGSSIQIGVPVGGSGGTSPYTYSWLPSATLSNSSISSPIATPLVANTTYTLAVTDNVGCTAKDNMTVYFIPDQYAVLYRTLDGGFHNLVNNKLFFKVDGEYNNNNTYNLNYNIYDKNNAVVASPAMTPSLLVPASLVSGDNRYSMNIASTTLASGFYILEVINEKKEKVFLRFKK